jgi:L-2-hydroxyglutarate oxidase
MKYDVVIVGGGIVGLATALQLKNANPGLRLAVIEKETSVARHQTGNNSGVIHSGVYYKPGSLKATNCIHGYHLLVQFCHEEGVPFELCGKIIVATDQTQLPLLENLFNRGLQNGLDQIRKISQAEIREHEPHVNGLAGIHVPYTGIVDYRLVAEKYADLLQRKGAELILGERVLDIKREANQMVVITQKKSYAAKLAINCAGLYSDKVASMTFKNLDVKIIPFRGEYFKLRADKEYLVKNLIYPVPDPNFPFLGVHFTRMRCWPFSARAIVNHKSIWANWAKHWRGRAFKKWLGNIGAPGWAKCIVRSPKLHSRKPCKSSFPRFRKAIWWKEAQVFAHKPATAPEDW